uniref:Uncharacterized protein n=1 Tax=Oryza rufipogon TaxID=4529 RepID=A0A0E0QJ47_ORYRU
MAGRPAPAPRPHRLPLALALQSPLPLLPATSHPSATGASRSQQPPPRRVWRNGTVGGRTQQETENRGILALLSRPLPPPPALHRSAPSAHVADTSVPGRIKEDSAATASAKSASSGEDVAAKRVEEKWYTTAGSICSANKQPLHTRTVVPGSLLRQQVKHVNRPCLCI